MLHSFIRSFVPMHWFTRSVLCCGPGTVLALWGSRKRYNKITDQRSLPRGRKTVVHKPLELVGFHNCHKENKNKFLLAVFFWLKKK